MWHMFASRCTSLHVQGTRETLLGTAEFRCARLLAIISRDMPGGVAFLCA